jgi:TP901 family phage tail tape measure protein
MAIRLFEIGFVLNATNFLSPVLAEVKGQIEQLNTAVKGTAGMREAGTNLAMIGGGIAAVGLAGAFALKSTVTEAATVNEAMQHLATNLDAGQAGVREYAEAQTFARAQSVQFNYAQKDIIDNLYRSKSILGDWNEALVTTQTSLAVAKGNMGDAATVGEALATVFTDFGNRAMAAAPQIQRFGDLMAYVSRNGAFHDVNELQEALSIGIGSAKAAGMSYEDTLAVLNAFRAVGMKGGEAGAALEETLAAFARGGLQKELGVALARTTSGGLDVIGTFVNLRRELSEGTISVEKFQRAAKALGIRGERATTVNVDDLVKMRDTLHDPNIVGGAAMKGAAIMLSAFNEQMGILGKRFDVLKDAVGSQLLGPIQTIGAALGTVVQAIGAFAEAHPQITKYVTLFAAIASAVLIVGGSLIALAGGALMLISFIGPAGAIVGVIAGIAAGLAAVGALIMTFPNEAKAAWDALGVIFSFPYKLGELGGEMLNAGFNLMKTFGEGIANGIMYPIKAIESLGTKLLSYLPRFSPAKEGPLADLGRLKFVETIADTIRPGPVVTAIRRVAAVSALAMPMIAGPMVSPAIGAGAGAGGIVVNVSYTIRVNGSLSDADEFKRMLHAHAHEVAEEVERVRALHARREF